MVAAHPDDEVLGFGGSISLLAAAGMDLTVVSVTDGERSHPHSRVETPESLARIRAKETRAALAELGAAEAEIIRLHVPDTDVADHEDQVAAALTEVMAGAALCAAPWTGDIHADHEAAGRAALTASGAAGVPCLHYPVWMWHWARPDDPRVPWAEAARIVLPRTTLARKDLGDQPLHQPDQPAGPRAGRRRDPAAGRDRPSSAGRGGGLPLSTPASYFETMYQHSPDPWHLADRWYEHRKYDLTLAALPQPRYHRAFEPACSVGELTSRLAERCDSAPRV